MSPSPADCRRPEWRAGLLLIVPLMALAVFAAACGSGSKAAATGSSTSTTPSSAAAAANRAKYTACLEQHGVPASVATAGFGRRPGGGAPGAGAGETPPTTDSTSTTVNPIRAQYASAFQACQTDLPQRFGNGGFQNSAAAKAYMNCLEAHGVTIPSTPPTTTAGEASGGGGFGAVSQNPNFKAAAAACAPLRPQFAGSTTTTAA